MRFMEQTVSAIYQGSNHEPREGVASPLAGHLPFLARFFVRRIATQKW
jgi:hypothetical protein